MKQVYHTIKYVNILNLLKIFCFPMRIGKTHITVNGITPFLFQEDKVDWWIITAPFNLIVDPNLRKLKQGQTKGNYIVENNITEVKRLLELGYNVVSCLTNANAFNTAKTKILNSKIDISRVGIIVDEADYGSVSGKPNMLNTKGYYNADYKAVMYNFVSMIAQKSTHTYAITATPNFEMKNFMSTVGQLNYKIFAEMKEGEQIQYAQRVGWANEVTFYNAKDNPLLNEMNETRQTILKAINSMVSIEEMTYHKRSSMFIVQDSDEELHDKAVAKILQEENDIVKTLCRIVKPEDFVGAAMTHDGFYLFNLLGKTKKITKDNVETEITDAIDDRYNPLRILLVKHMAGRGVTFKTIKELMLLRTSNPKGKYGFITETTEQSIGRAKSPYCGRVSIESLYNDYEGDIRNIPKHLFPNSLINSYNVYLPNNDKNKDAWNKHLKFDACTFDMLDWNIDEICPHCNGTGILNGKSNKNIDDNFSGISKELE